VGIVESWIEVAEKVREVLKSGESSVEDMDWEASRWGHWWEGRWGGWECLVFRTGWDVGEVKSIEGAAIRATQ
jgi:hypothetical protein